MKKPLKTRSGLVWSGLVCLILMLSSCGENPAVTTSLPQQENSLLSSTPTPTPSLVSKPVKGFIYGYNTITEGGETISNISVLEIPAANPDSSGNVPLINQFSDYLRQEYPQDWNNPDIQELNSRLCESLAQYKPLGEYDTSAKVFSVYQDSQTDTPLSVNPEGQFEGNVVTSAQGSTVKLEVTLGEDETAETEIISSSDTISSSDASGAVLKLCPEKIIVLPNDIVIFKVFSEPSIDLKKAGLKFSLNNNSIGCIAPPVYLCVFGERKHSVAYSALYIKKNLDTPVDCVISATTSNGLSLNIPLSVVKRCACISGRVYTGDKPLIKGYVKSIGPKAHCKLDGDGGYSLPAVFLGHGRTVIATYWVQENGKKVKYREEKVIEFFNDNVSNFNFGVPPTPTPTLTPSVTPTPRPPYDEFYNKKVSTVLYQYNQWETELGKEEAIQRIITWLNGELPDGPPVPDEIAGASSKDNPYDIWIHFRDSMSVCISTSDTIIVEEPDPNEEPIQKEEIKPISRLNASANTTVKNADVLILSPYYWQASIKPFKVEDIIKDTLIGNGYNVTCKNPKYGNHKYDPAADFYFDWENPIREVPDDPLPTPEPGEPKKPLIECYLKSNWDNNVTPLDFETMGKYGIIYINTHGWSYNKEDPDNPDSEPTNCVISCCIDIRNLNRTNKTPIDIWVESNHRQGFCYYIYRDIKFDSPGIDPKKAGWIRTVSFTNDYISYLNNNPARNFEGSLMYVSCCRSYGMRNYFNSARAYLGNRIYGNSKWTYPFAYYFFWFMMNGPEGCAKATNGILSAIKDAPVPEGTPSFDEDIPMDAHGALKQLTDYYKVNPDPNPYDDPGEDDEGKGCTVKIWQKDPDEHIYFPVPVTVTVHKK